MRLFIAIELDDNIKNALIKIQGNLKKQNITGNYTSIDNTHITLAFFGEYPNPEEILEVMKNVPFEPFTLTLGGFGSFGNIWWTGLEKSEELLSYVKRLRHALSDADIPYDRKKFSPHITVIRKAVCRKGLPRITVPHKTMTVKKISLYRSDRGKNGMIYTELGNINFID